MKILFDGRPKQFDCVSIICSDRLMGEILNSRSNIERHNLIQVDDFSKARSGSGLDSFSVMLKSGAKLCVGKKRNEFYLYGYHYAGQDILDAAAELIKLEAVRKAGVQAARIIASFPRSVFQS